MASPLHREQLQGPVLSVSSLSNQGGMLGARLNGWYQLSMQPGRLSYHTEPGPGKITFWGVQPPGGPARNALIMLGPIQQPSQEGRAIRAS